MGCNYHSTDKKRASAKLDTPRISRTVPPYQSLPIKHLNVFLTWETKNYTLVFNSKKKFKFALSCSKAWRAVETFPVTYLATKAYTILHWSLSDPLSEYVSRMLLIHSFLFFPALSYHFFIKLFPTWPQKLTQCIDLSVKSAEYVSRMSSIHSYFPLILWLHWDYVHNCSWNGS